MILFIKDLRPIEYQLMALGDSLSILETNI